MKKKMVQLLLTFTLCWLALLSLTDAYPVESKPLNNNPETWNFGDGWNLFNNRDSSDPSASALVSSDPHIKKSKITPKSIFIAPNAYNDHPPCPHGFRVDDNGKCLKTMTVNLDEVLAARLSELFSIDENQNKSSETDGDYYDFVDDTKSEKDSGPLQFTLPLAIDIEETIDGKKVEYVIEEKVVMRNLDPSNLTTTTTSTTTEKPEASTTIQAPVTEVTESVSTDEPTTSATTNVIVEETATVTEVMTTESSTVKSDEDEVTTSMPEPTTVEAITTTSTTTAKPTTAVPQVKIFSVDFLPKSQRKSNRLSQQNARFKNSRDQDKLNRPRKQKTTAISTKTNEKSTTKLYKIDRGLVPKKNRTRTGSKRPGYRKVLTTTEVVTEIPTTSTTTKKPFWWLPRGWSIDDSRVVRFWSDQPLPQDETARSHSSRQRVNSRMPSENIFREVTPSGLDSD